MHLEASNEYENIQPMKEGKRNAGQKAFFLS